jgi:hypothetical protein
MTELVEIAVSYSDDGGSAFLTFINNRGEPEIAMLSAEEARDLAVRLLRLEPSLAPG